jgi:proteasome lid subunit RPN8/RPN11
MATKPNLHLPAALREDVHSLVRAGYPFETCGLLLGHRGNGGREVSRVFPGHNLNQARRTDRFELDPRDYLAADREARASGEEIVGVWHSHPDHPAQPSDTDLAAAWPEWSYLIVSVSGERVLDVRSWRLSKGGFEEEEITP